MSDSTVKRYRSESGALKEDREPPPKRAREKENGDKRKAEGRRRSDSYERKIRNRDRSRSPERRRDYRTLEKSSHRDRRDEAGGGKRPRSRSRERQRYPRGSSPKRHRSRSPRLAYGKKIDRASDEAETPGSRAVKLSTNAKKVSSTPQAALRVAEGDELGSEFALVKEIMGFSRFKSTKNTKVPGNNVGAVRRDKQIRARQYMNRVGGFNRPLSPGR